MRFQCKRSVLTEAFQTVAGVVPSRTANSILKKVKLEVFGGTGVLLGTDGEIGLRVAVELNAAEGGQILLATSRVLAILKELQQDDVEVEANSDTVWIRSGLSEFRLSTEDAADFPPVSDWSGDNYHVISAGTLRTLIRRTIFATDNDSARYALGGIQIEFGADTVTFAATDTRRLAVASASVTAQGRVEVPVVPPVVPSKAMALLERRLSDSSDVWINVKEHSIALRCGTTTITSQLIQGRFPDWRKVFPKSFMAGTDVVVGSLYSAVRQSMIVTNEESRGVEFKFNAGTLTLSSQAADIGKSKIDLPITYDADAFTSMLDPRYVADCLKVIDPAAQVRIGLVSNDDPIMLSADDYQYVLMPLARN